MRQKSRHLDETDTAHQSEGFRQTGALTKEGFWYQFHDFDSLSLIKTMRSGQRIRKRKCVVRHQFWGKAVKLIPLHPTKDMSRVYINGGV